MLDTQHLPLYKNPYDFVPLEGGINRPCHAHPQDTWDFQARTGEMVCRLTTQSPLFIHAEGAQGEWQHPRQFFHRNSKPVIPASSLKGLIRSVAEVAANACLGSLSEEYVGRTGLCLATVDLVPPEYQTCARQDDLCFCCALFGMVERGAAPEEKEKKAPLAGRVFFADGEAGSDTRLVQVEMPAYRTRDGSLAPVTGQPRPSHGDFYLDTQGHILGRKFYYHHQDYRTTREFYRPDFPRNLVIETREGSFTFKVHFENLSDDELAILAYSLHLEDGIAHHFGFGKALGLGAVKIEITEMSLWSFQTSPQGIVGPSRFLSYKLPDSSQRTESPGYWAEKGRRLWGSRGPSADQARNKFLEILKWPQTENFKYPGRDWFSKVQGVTLAEYQGRVHQMAPGTAAQPQPGTRLRGTVKTVSPERGFAFVTSPSGTDVYVPLREVRDQEPLQLGQEVEFTLGTDAQGRHQARAVVIVRR